MTIETVSQVPPTNTTPTPFPETRFCANPAVALPVPAAAAAGTSVVETVEVVDGKRTIMRLKGQNAREFVEKPFPENVGRCDEADEQDEAGDHEAGSAEQEDAYRMRLERQSACNKIGDGLDSKKLQESGLDAEKLLNSSRDGEGQDTDDGCDDSDQEQDQNQDQAEDQDQDQDQDHGQEDQDKAEDQDQDQDQDLAEDQDQDQDHGQEDQDKAEDQDQDQEQNDANLLHPAGQNAC